MLASWGSQELLSKCFSESSTWYWPPTTHACFHLNSHNNTEEGTVILIQHKRGLQVHTTRTSGSRAPDPCLCLPSPYICYFTLPQVHLSPRDRLLRLASQTRTVTAASELPFHLLGASVYCRGWMLLSYCSHPAQERPEEGRSLKWW